MGAGPDNQRAQRQRVGACHRHSDAERRRRRHHRPGKRRYVHGQRALRLVVRSERLSGDSQCDHDQRQRGDDCARIGLAEFSVFLCFRGIQHASGGKFGAEQPNADWRLCTRRQRRYRLRPVLFLGRWRWRRGDGRCHLQPGLPFAERRECDRKSGGGGRRRRCGS